MQSTKESVIGDVYRGRAGKRFQLLKFFLIEDKLCKEGNEPLPCPAVQAANRLGIERRLWPSHATHHLNPRNQTYWVYVSAVRNTAPLQEMDPASVELLNLSHTAEVALRRASPEEFIFAAQYGR